MSLFNVFYVIGARILWILGFPFPSAQKQAEEPLDMSERKKKRNSDNSSTSDAQRIEGKTGKAQEVPYFLPHFRELERAWATMA